MFVSGVEEWRIQVYISQNISQGTIYIYNLLKFAVFIR